MGVNEQNDQNNYGIENSIFSGIEGYVNLYASCSIWDKNVGAHALAERWCQDTREEEGEVKRKEKASKKHVNGFYYEPLGQDYKVPCASEWFHQKAGCCGNLYWLTTLHWWGWWRDMDSGAGSQENAWRWRKPAGRQEASSGFQAGNCKHPGSHLHLQVNSGG